MYTFTDFSHFFLWIQNVYSIRTKFDWLAPTEHLKTSTAAAAKFIRTHIDKQTKWLQLGICRSTARYWVVSSSFTLPFFRFDTTVRSLSLLSLHHRTRCDDKMWRCTGTRNLRKVHFSWMKFVCKCWKCLHSKHLSPGLVSMFIKQFYEVDKLLRYDPCIVCSVHTSSICKLELDTVRLFAYDIRYTKYPVQQITEINATDISALWIAMGWLFIKIWLSLRINYYINSHSIKSHYLHTSQNKLIAFMRDIRLLSNLSVIHRQNFTEFRMNLCTHSFISIQLKKLSNG